MELAKMLTSILRERRWTLTKLAKESGVPVSTIHAWANGGKALDLDKLKKVSDTLEISLHQLVFGTPDPHEPISGEILKELFTGDLRVTVHRIEKQKRAND